MFDRGCRRRFSAQPMERALADELQEKGYAVWQA